jgi:transcriptional repressor NrdR
MVCVFCGAETHIINSRWQKRKNQVWRRRKCWDCLAVFTTGEAPDYDATWLVKDRYGSLRPFSRDKLLLSLHKSCGHRKTALEDAGGLVETIIGRLADDVSNGTIEGRRVAQIALVALNRFDAAAATHYQAFHK